MSALTGRRQVIYWRMLAAIFGMEGEARGLNTVTRQLLSEEDLPDLLLDPSVGIDTLIQRFPQLEQELADLVPDPQDDETADQEPLEVRRDLLFSKLLLNVFGPHTQQPVISAAGYQQWTRDLSHLEGAFGCPPGTLRGKAGGGGSGGGAPGSGRMVSEDELRRGMADMEAELVRRMALREVLKDNKLASQLTPSMALIEQLLRDKSNLSGAALNNARALIRRYVTELAEVLKTQVEQAPMGKIDYDIPPKRIFRNLDLKRTIWRNLPNYNPEDGRLYVDRLYYHHTARKTNPTRLIVVVDQSGSMVDAMVQCTILASIFSQLPQVDAHLLAFDTRVVDLSAWVHDPFEVLLRTQLGGGTHIRLALEAARQKILEPRNTCLVLISDFYEGGSNEALLNSIREIAESGCHFIPVGAVTAGGYYSVSPWFRARLKELGMPVLSGHIKKLIVQLKQLL